jgi:hypothetical protein
VIFSPSFSFSYRFSARYASLVVDGELRFYCVPHFKELFKRHADYTHGFRSDTTVEPDPHLQEKK